MDILFASGNLHKRGEVAALFPNHRIILPQECGLGFDVEESGLTFLENAMLKALALRSLWSGPILADDSGICLPALGGLPGIYSARFGSEGGKNLSSEERNELLLEKMRGRSDRECAFVCSMVLSLGQDRFFIAQETLEGRLLDSPRGKGGFGYDPIVWIEEKQCSVAELTEEEKNIISHRGKAAHALCKLFP